MNTNRNTGREIGGATAGVNHIPPQAPTAGMEMPVNPTGLTDGEVTKTLVQMAHARTVQA